MHKWLMILFIFLLPSHATNSLPVQVHVWKEKPSVWLCTGAPVGRVNVESAVLFWKKLGYKFGSVSVVDGSTNLACDGAMVNNVIVIALDTRNQAPKDKAAVTAMHFDKLTGEIFSSHVYMKISCLNRPRVLEHEMGHALGWAHTNRKNHLMNGDWSQSGWDVTGLNYKY